jgi:glycosyltransferase involved in cell wall biosynthesis
MAAGLAVVSPDVGDVAEMVSVENREYISRPGNEEDLASKIAALGFDDALRKAVGEANRKRAEAEYDEKTMVSAYRTAYARALRQPEFP